MNTNVLNDFDANLMFFPLTNIHRKAGQKSFVIQVPEGHDNGPAKCSIAA